MGLQAKASEVGKDDKNEKTGCVLECSPMTR
jgi:hypothetical protein